MLKFNSHFIRTTFMFSACMSLSLLPSYSQAGKVEDLLRTDLPSHGETPKNLDLAKFPHGFVQFNYNILGFYASGIQNAQIRLNQAIERALGTSPENTKGIPLEEIELYVHMFVRSGLREFPTRFINLHVARKLHDKIASASKVEELAEIEKEIPALFEESGRSLKGPFSKLADQMDQDLSKVDPDSSIGKDRFLYMALSDGFRAFPNSEVVKKELEFFTRGFAAAKASSLSKSLEDQKGVILRNLSKQFPENTKFRDTDFWAKRKAHVCSLIQRIIKRGEKAGELQNLPFLGNFQEVNAEQLVDLRECFQQAKINAQFVSISTHDKDKTDLAQLQREAEENKPKDGLGFLATSVFDASRWELEKKDLVWISETPDVPSITPGGATHQKNPILILALRDRMNGKKLFLMNTHVSFMEKAHAFSAQFIAKKIRELSDNGKNEVIFSADMNTYLKAIDVKDPTGPETYATLFGGQSGSSMGNSAEQLLDARVVAESRTSPEAIRFANFMGYPSDAEATKFNGKALVPNILDLIVLSSSFQNRVLSFDRDPGAIDWAKNGLNGQLIGRDRIDQALDALMRRDSASDHFMQSVLIRE